MICCLAAISACKKDGDFMKLSGIKSAELLSSETTVVLTKDNTASSVLALTWNKSNITISDTSKGVPGSVPEEVIEVSATSNFATITNVVPQGNTYAFLGAALNTLGKNIGFKGGVSSPMYFRIRTALGSNTKPYYSNVVTVNVTCYSIDMSLGFVLDSKKVDTGFKLYSPNSNGEYHGFAGATAWYNWFLLEGDGTVWGNDTTAGAFTSANYNRSWNFWYPGNAGCYYTTLSTKNKEWTATYIPTLNVRGDVNTTMTFDRVAVKWYASFTTTAANQKVKVTCSNASLYNKSTSTTDANAIAKTIGFVPHADSTLTFDWNSASAGDITISKAGDYTLTFYLSDPKKWTYQVKSGKAVVVKPLSKYLYLPGIDDGITNAAWNFNNYLRQVSETDSTFAGSVLVNSKWGYEMTLDSGEWTNVYKMGSSEGTLAFKGASNITAPAAGLYLIQADLKKLTYSHTAISSLSYAGLNDNWTLAAMAATSVPGVYASSVTINGPSPWGCKLYMNGSWDYFYGGANGALTYKGSGFRDDTTLVAGTYDLIANIRNNTYVFLSDVVYIGGINDDWSESSSMTLSKTSTGIYSGTITITKTSSWGMTIQLDKTWKRFFGGSFNSLKYLGANIKDDQSLATGTYDVTVDFINNKCSFVLK
jgi:hypothetical protein